MDLIETAKALQGDLIDALEQWENDYSKDDTWQQSSRSAANESRIIALSANHHPAYNGMLYRGTGISDADYHVLEHGGDVTFRQSSSKKLVSWTKDMSVAKSFAEDAVDSGFSSVVIAMHSSRLQMLVDIDEALGMPTGESEVIVLSRPIELNASNVVEMLKYDDDNQKH